MASCSFRLKSLRSYAEPPKQLQATRFADRFGHEVLFASEPSAYGHYLDYFIPAPPSCTVNETAYDVADCLAPESSCVRTDRSPTDDFSTAHPELDRLVFIRNAFAPFNSFYARHFLFPAINRTALPLLSSTRVLPAEATLPPSLVSEFEGMQAMFEKHFSFNAAMQEVIGETRRNITSRAERGSPIVGVHFRGGDKLAQECPPSTILSWCGSKSASKPKLSSLSHSGNVTMHSEAAWNAYRDLHPGHTGVKPTLMLLTAEGNMLDQFASDPIGSRFTVVAAPNRDKLASFNQGAFNSRACPPLLCRCCRIRSGAQKRWTIESLRLACCSPTSPSSVANTPSSSLRIATLVGWRC